MRLIGSMEYTDKNVEILYWEAANNNHWEIDEDSELGDTIKKKLKVETMEIDTSKNEYPIISSFFNKDFVKDINYIDDPDLPATWKKVIIKIGSYQFKSTKNIRTLFSA